MQEALEQIAERPALHSWLASGEWSVDFGSGALKRSRDYANDGSVMDIEWIDLDGSGELIVTSCVSGSQRRPYETSLLFNLSRDAWSVESDCSCPVSYQCKHGAATLRVLQQRLREIPIDFDRNPAELIEEDDAVDENAERFLAYCIEVPLDSSLKTHQFVMRVAQRLRSGKVKILGGVANADPGKPADFMTEADVTLVDLYQQRQLKLGAWGAMPMEGSDWDELLDGALATGRMFLGKEINDNRGSTEHQPLQTGEVENVIAYWENLPDGSVRPAVRSSRFGLVFLPIVTPRYLDPTQPSLGKMSSDIPPSVLATWTRGPVIKREGIPSLIERLSRFPGTTLPVPVVIKTITRPNQPPRPILKITKTAFGPSWDRTEWVVGKLFFEYGDSPRLPPLANHDPRQHTAMVAGQRVVWPRDVKAERAADAELMRSSLVPLAKRLPGRFIDAASQQSVVPENHGIAPQLAWIELLQSPTFESLRENGWLIEVDPRAGLTARDASDFVPAIETETEHGIDWFRFDISYEMDGRRFSLIPVIAQAIEQDYPSADSPDLPEHILVNCENPDDGFIRFPARQLMEIVDGVRHLFTGSTGSTGLRLDRLSAATVADSLEIDATDTSRTLARLGRSLRDISELPEVEVPPTVNAELRDYQTEGFRWLQFLASQGLHGILADDMGLGKTIQTLTHLAAEHSRKPGKPSLVIAPTSVVPNWATEAAKFVPALKVITLHGPGRAKLYAEITDHDIVLTSYPLLSRDSLKLLNYDWHVIVLDEAQHIKNPKAMTARSAFKLKATQRICLSGTPMENHLGELWSLMHFLMPGFLGDEKSFGTRFRRPIERDHSADVQQALNRRVSSLILRRTKDQVATELPAKTELIHHVDLSKKQTQLYESVRASMDSRVREAIASKGLAKSHIIVLDALLKLRQICCHPKLLKNAPAITDSAKFYYFTEELLPTLLEEKRRILLFSQFTSMLALIQENLEKSKIPFLKLTGQTKKRGAMVEEFQKGDIPIFLISLKAGGTGLNLTAADTVIHYDPWWNPAAENQATDRAHRIGQTKPVFVHKLVCRGTIEDRILDLQKHKAAMVEALLSDETAKLKIDSETLSHLLAPLE